MNITYCEIETPYGDRFVIRDGFGSTTDGWSKSLGWETVPKRCSAKSPEDYAKDGYKVISKTEIPTTVLDKMS